jgi:hypothetical protein
MNKCVGCYVRVSPLPQEVRTQVKMLEDEAKAKGFRVVKFEAFQKLYQGKTIPENLAVLIENHASGKTQGHCLAQ